MPRKLKSADEQSKRVNITLPPYINSLLEKLVEEKHVSKSTIITLAIEYYASTEEKRK